MEDWIAQAIDKRTGYFGTCTHCADKQSAVKTAKYYRSVGYNAKVFSEQDYDKALETDSQNRQEQMRRMRECGIITLE